MLVVVVWLLHIIHVSNNSSTFTYIFEYHRIALLQLVQFLFKFHHFSTSRSFRLFLRTCKDLAIAPIYYLSTTQLLQINYLSTICTMQVVILNDWTKEMRANSNDKNILFLTLTSLNTYVLPIGTYFILLMKPDFMIV